MRYRCHGTLGEWGRVRANGIGCSRVRLSQGKGPSMTLDSESEKLALIARFPAYVFLFFFSGSGQ